MLLLKMKMMELYFIHFIHHIKKKMQLIKESKENESKSEEESKTNENNNNKWNCSFCTFENIYKNKECIMCNIGKYEIISKTWNKNQFIYKFIYRRAEEDEYNINKILLVKQIHNIGIIESIYGEYSDQ
eukprot:528370_1